MGVIEILFLAVALSMDACAVAMTDGMSNPKMRVGKALIIALLFGVFQGLMPVIGYFITGVVADAFLSTFEKISGWIAFALLVFLGVRMLIESIKEMHDCGCEDSETMGACTGLPATKPAEALTVSKLFMQAIATSIDALAVGVTLQMAAISEAGLALGVWGATGVIALITFLLSTGAVYIGKAVGNKLASKAGVFGGAVLIAIGIKILVESFL
jgi:putative Mn2+ efflux pump MntP